MTAHIKQNTPEWLQLRKNKIGASESAAILGISPYMTARKLWAQKLDIIPTDPPTKAMMEGQRLEPFAREWFINETGIQMLPDVCFHPDIPWMMASLDGVNHEQETLLEIKCGLSSWRHDKAACGIIPEHDLCQIQHQLAVTGYKKALYVSYFEEQGIIIPVDRNEQFIEDTLIPSLKEFWDCLSNLIEPPLQDGDYEKIDTYEWNLAANEYRTIGEQIKQLTEYQNNIKNNLINMCGDHNCIGGGVRVIKTKRKGVVDYGSIPELESVNLEQYRKKGSEYWTIREV